MRARFRRFFLTGLAALLPTLLTFWIVIRLYGWLHDKFGTNMQALLRTHAYPDNWRSNLFYRAVDPLLGDVVVVLLFLIFAMLVGFFLASYLGRAMFNMVERRVVRIPLVRQVYSFLKQIIEFFLSEEKVQYSGVAAVQYPRHGIWSIGLLTGDGMKQLMEKTDQNLVTLFIPSSPTPFTGYTIQVPRSDVVSMRMTVEEALRFCVSGGVILPDHQVLPDGGGTLPDETPTP